MGKNPKTKALTLINPKVFWPIVNAVSVTDVSENEILRFVLTGVPSHSVAEELHLEDWEPRFLVPTNKLGLTGCPGDIDAILVSNKDYEHPSAIECKRIKFKANSVIHDGERANKLNQLAKAVRQTNGLLRMGFSRVFLLVVVQVDARQQPMGNWLCKGLSGPQSKLVERSIPLQRLNSSAGVMVVELTQPADKEIYLAGGIGFTFSRPATLCPQSRYLTSEIKRYFEETRISKQHWA